MNTLARLVWGRHARPLPRPARRPRAELLESRRLLTGLLLPLPVGFEAAAAGKADGDTYLVAGRINDLPAVVRVERSGGAAQTSIEIFDGLPGGDGRGAIGDLTAAADLFVGASQSARSNPAGFGEATFWSAAGAPTAIDASTIPGTDDMLLGVSENGVAAGVRFGSPIVATSGGVSLLPGGQGQADAVSDDGRTIVGSAGGETVFWTSSVAEENYTLRDLELPPNSSPRDERADVAGDGSWIGGVFFSQEKFDIAPALWDSAGRLVHVFPSPLENRSIVVDTQVAVVNGIVDQIDFEPTTRIYFEGADGSIDLHGWLAAEGIDVSAVEELHEAFDVAHRLADRELLIVGEGLSQSQPRSFLAIVDDFEAPIPTTAAVSGRAWQDGNGDGRQDADEFGAADVSVELRDAAGQIVAATVTDQQGFYEFRGLAPGQYRVRVNPPAGLRLSPRGLGGDDRVDSDVSPFTSETDLLTITAGQNRDIDAGITEAPPGPAWRNPVLAADVNASGAVTISDLLEIVAEIRRGGVGPLPTPSESFQPAPYLDVDGNGLLTPNDMLQVITVLRNNLGAPAGEGEAASSPVDRFWGLFEPDDEEDWLESML
jgi:hypothetical protein